MRKILFFNKLFRASTCFEHMLIITRSRLYYTASGIITLKQVSGLKLLKYVYKYEQIVVKFMCEFLV